MKIKIIDLLNNIYNQIDVPKKIKFGSHIWTYRDEFQDNQNEDNEYLLEVLMCDIEKTKEILNIEVEIIEEDKKIEKLKIKDGKITGNWENGNYYCYTLSSPQAVIVNKLNELVDEVNKLKENK